MKKVKYAILAVFSLLLCFCLGACEWLKEYYFYNYHVVWYSDDPFIEFIGDDYEGTGKMILDGTEYDIDIGGLGNYNFVYFYFYNQATHGTSTIKEEYLIWQGTAQVKNGQLFLTVETDNISDYAGKTIVLNQRPVDETE